jgi:general secretion pathway protein C
MKDFALKIWLRFQAFIVDKKPQFSEPMVLFASQVVACIFLSFILASVVSSFCIPFLVHPFLHGDSRKVARETFAVPTPTMNYVTSKKVILARNLFTASGEVPEGEGAAKSGKFDDSAPCTPSKAKITLVGTIHSDAGDSHAVMQETGYEFSDIYGVGDILIGTTSSIVRIDRNLVVLNNGGMKECIELKSTVEGRDKVSSGAVASSGAPVSLTSSWVSNELGDGFGKIIKSALVVPNMEGEKANGFKVLHIEPGTLFDKIGLKDGDVVTKVNKTTLDPEKGFDLYQAFLDYREISLYGLRQGKDPFTISVKIQ